MRFPHADLDWITVTRFYSIGISFLIIVIHYILVQFGLTQGMRVIHANLGRGQSPRAPPSVIFD
ncbi:MAG: hypothetical protein AAF549_09365 [Pseudomonadota bacterium]